VKIAVITNRFPALSQTFVINQVTGLIDRGHDVTVFARGEEPAEVMHADVERYGLRERTRHFPRGLRGWPPVLLDAANMLRRRPVLTVRTALRSLRPSLAGPEFFTLAPLARAMRTLPADDFDAVVSFFGPNGVTAEELRAIGALSGRTFTIFLGYDLSSRIQKQGPDVYRRLWADGDVMLPICEYFRDKIIDLGCDPGKIRIHHLGIDTGDFAFQPRTLSEGEPVRVLSVARMVDKKGLQYGLRAVEFVLREHPNLEYHIVGDGPLRGELEQLIEDLGIRAHVILHGWKSQEELRELQKTVHLLMAPSVTAENGDEEGTPVVLMEALAAGLPVLSTQHSGIPEVVEHGVSGYLVPERDVEALAVALRRLVREPQRWPEMGEKGRARMEAEFNISTQNDRLAELLAGG
jgi:colanic acid/amylovoran biosynthesis glycosyltransferase